jgi:Retron-type reverse transcriptase
MLPETVIRRVQSLSVISKTGKRVNGLFRLMQAPLLWEQAYQKIAPNKGALTPGVDGATFDGFSPDKVHSIIARLMAGTYKTQPVRRVHIPKANGKTRPLGIPTTEDKLVQEVVRVLLERIYEPVFSEHSHGFRPGRSCHTALETIRATWSGMKWLVDVDVTGFFDNIDHGILLGLLAERIADRRFLALIRGMLKAGYVEDWAFRPTYSGTPQGGVVSPLLANIYLHELDRFMERRIAAFHQGTARALHPEWGAITARMSTLRAKVKRQRARGDTAGAEATLAEVRRLTERRFAVPYGDPFDPDYRRLRYCRYADDFLIGVIGSKAEARRIMSEVAGFLAEHLRLQISAEKSCVCKATDGARFLGYDVCTYSPQRRVMATLGGGRRAIQRTSADRLQLKVPRDRVAKFCREKGYGDFDAFRAKHRDTLLHASDVEIVMAYNAEFRGFATYYALAKDVKSKLSKLEHLQTLSLGKTLASKHDSTVSKVLNRMRMGREYGIRYQVHDRTRVVRLWKLKHLRPPPRTWGKVDIPPFADYGFTRTELVERLNAQECMLCGATDQPCEVHHVRKLADLKDTPYGRMAPAARLRKRIVLCRSCHHALHAGRLPDWRAR